MMLQRNNRSPDAAALPESELRELLERRAERLRQQPTGTEEESLLWVADFPIGEDRFAIALDALRGAVPIKLVTSIPLAPPYVIGILRFQGQILSALSLSALLGVRGWRQDPAVLLIVDTGRGQLMAVDCEQIPRPVGLPMTLVEEARTRSQGAVLEITTRDLQQVNLIDNLNRLLDQNQAGMRHGA